ncbi:MAG: PDZ domain-containing protein [Planctomycetota bacterium]
MLFATLFLVAPLQAASPPPPPSPPLAPSAAQAAPSATLPPVPPAAGGSHAPRATAASPLVRLGLRPLGQSKSVAPSAKPVDGTMGVQITERAREDGDTTAVVVVEVLPGSVAAQAGLAARDRFVEVEGQPVNDIAGLTRALGGKSAGETVEVVVERDGKTRTFRFALGGAGGRPVERDAGASVNGAHDPAPEVEVEVETELRLDDDGDVRVFRWSGGVDDGVIHGFFAKPDGETREFEFDVEEDLPRMLGPLRNVFEGQDGLQGLLQNLPQQLQELEFRCGECAEDLEQRLQTWEQRFSNRMQDLSRRLEARVERFERRLEREAPSEERGRAPARLREELRRNQEATRREALRQREQAERARAGALRQRGEAERQREQAERQREAALKRGREVERRLLLERERDDLHAELEVLRAEVERLRQRLNEQQPRDL